MSNVKTRVITALLLLAGFLAALFVLPPAAWAGMVTVLTLIAIWEWAGLAGLGPLARPAYAIATTFLLGILFGLGMPHHWLEIPYARFFYLGATLFWLTLAPLWLVFRWRWRNPLWLALLGWCLLLPVWLALIGLRGTDPWLLLAVMAVVWLADSAAYFAGRRFGRRKLAPAISPGKTWEGVWGALFAVGLCVPLAWWLAGVGMTAAGLLAGVGFAWLLAVLSIEGDLLESLLKRQAGVKDSGNLLPGHGGMLDRIDGLLPVLPFAALAFSLLTGLD